MGIERVRSEDEPHRSSGEVFASPGPSRRGSGADPGQANFQREIRATFPLATPYKYPDSIRSRGICYRDVYGNRSRRRERWRRSCAPTYLRISYVLSSLTGQNMANESVAAPSNLPPSVASPVAAQTAAPKRSRLSRRKKIILAVVAGVVALGGALFLFCPACRTPSFEVGCTLATGVPYVDDSSGCNIFYTCVSRLPSDTKGRSCNYDTDCGDGYCAGAYQGEPLLGGAGRHAGTCVGTIMYKTVTSDPRGYCL